MLKNAYSNPLPSKMLKYIVLDHFTMILDLKAVFSYEFKSVQWLDLQYHWKIMTFPDLNDVLVLR